MAKKDTVRLTVDLTSNQQRKLRLIASHNNVSMAKMMRDMIDSYFSTLVKNGINLGD
jgi:hypothetical protein